MPFTDDYHQVSNYHFFLMISDIDCSAMQNAQIPIFDRDKIVWINDEK